MVKILLVEDDAALAVGLKYSMEKEGYQVTTAGGVHAGLSEFGQGNFGLVVLDITLPDGTGFDLCRQIRGQSTVPILFLTACDEETDVVMGLDMGGDEYITKPFRLRELLSRINALLRRSTEGKEDKLRSRGYLLKAEEGRLLRGETDIPLTPAECRLAYLLMSNRNCTLTRSQLLAKLWDNAGDFVDANTLTVYIRRLREKIEKDPSNPNIILTIRGIGYQWSDPHPELEGKLS
ncbi:MAG TPA: response regulator transcription factor [Clostridia bacterium]|nr:response regulator transcription factor [Clostridia bacterium]